MEGDVLGDDRERGRRRRPLRPSAMRATHSRTVSSGAPGWVKRQVAVILHRWGPRPRRANRADRAAALAGRTRPLGSDGARAVAPIPRQQHTPSRSCAPVPRANVRESAGISGGARRLQRRPRGPTGPLRPGDAHVGRRGDPISAPLLGGAVAKPPVCVRARTGVGPVGRYAPSVFEEMTAPPPCAMIGYQMKSRRNHQAVQARDVKER